MKYCTSCGKELKVNAKFCSKCGQMVEREKDEDVLFADIKEEVAESKESTKNPKREKFIVYVICAIILAIIVGKTVYNNAYANRFYKLIETGNKYLNELDYERAVASFTKALKIDPNDEEVKRLLADAYIGWGEDLVKDGELDLALAKIDEARDILGDMSELDLLENRIQRKQIETTKQETEQQFDSTGVSAVTILSSLIEKNSYDNSGYSVVLGKEHSAALMEDGTLWMWGSNSFGQLGDGTTIDRYEPVKIMDNVKSVSLGGTHSAAIKEDGSLWMWGSESCGQLGNGVGCDITHYDSEYLKSYIVSKPIKIMDNVKQVSIATLYSAAIKEDGSLWIWGFTIGDCYVFTSEPMHVMDDVAYIHCGGIWNGDFPDVMLAVIKNDKSLWMLGLDSFLNGHQLGEQPYFVMDGVENVNVSGNGLAIIKNDKSLWMCGSNYDGQVGNGTREKVNSLEKIMDNVVCMSYGNSFTAAVKEDGSLWMWGNTINGVYYEPVKFMDNVKSVSLGGWHGAAIKEDGSLWMWGSNNKGQLGDGTNTNRYEPVITRLLRDGEF